MMRVGISVYAETDHDPWERARGQGMVADLLADGKVAPNISQKTGAIIIPTNNLGLIKSWKLWHKDTDEPYLGG